MSKALMPSIFCQHTMFAEGAVNSYFYPQFSRMTGRFKNAFSYVVSKLTLSQILDKRLWDTWQIWPKSREFAVRGFIVNSYMSNACSSFVAFFA